MSGTDPSKNWGCIQVPAKGKQCLPLRRHLPCYSYIQDVYDTTMHKHAQITFNSLNNIFCRYNALNPINFLEGPQADPDTVVKKMPKHTKGDFDNFITRIQNMPRQVHKDYFYLSTRTCIVLWYIIWSNPVISKWKGVIILFEITQYSSYPW